MIGKVAVERVANAARRFGRPDVDAVLEHLPLQNRVDPVRHLLHQRRDGVRLLVLDDAVERLVRSEEHTSELQSLMRISYAVFCLKKKTQIPQHKKYIKNTS